MEKSLLFRKTERLSSQKVIQSLYTEGNSFYSYPFRIQWKVNKPMLNYPAQVCVSVPKKLFKKAHNRNLIRRRIKEAYRLNKNGWYEELKKRNVQLAFMLVYTGKEIPKYSLIEEKIILALNRLVKELGRENESNPDNTETIK